LASLYITECKSLGWAPLGGQLVQAPHMPPVNEQKLSITTTSTASTTWTANTFMVMVETDATCSLAWTSSATVTATATTSAQRMAAGETRFYMVDPGGSLAVVTNS
jgi:hypothetical protein